MAEAAASAIVHPEHAERSVSIPLVVGAAVLVGIGLMGMAYWLITFRWVFFASLIPLVGGALLLFSRLTGPDHA